MAVPPPSYASVGYPHVPYQQHAAPQQPPEEGAVYVEYQGRGCCCNSQPRRGAVAINCDGVRGCKVSQGGKASFVAPAGLHKFSVYNDTPMDKLFRGIFGSGSSSEYGPTLRAMVPPNGKLVLRVRWESEGCCSTEYNLDISVAH